MRRFLRILVVLVGLAVFCWLLPPVRVVRLERASEVKSPGAFNAAEFAQKFWTNQLLPAVAKATSAEELISLLRSDPNAARQKFGRSLGLSQSCNFFLAGTGTVVGVFETEVLVAVTPGTRSAEIALQTGLVFGNTVRDGTGLIDVNDYPNSQDFNAISAELNRITEERVVPQLRQLATVGARIKFAGCAEWSSTTSAPLPLRVIPVLAAPE